MTRQTVSKWELGQTTPEMEKLTEMSRLFNISVDELINDSEITSNVNPIIEDKPIGEEKSKSNKVLVIIVVALIVVILLIVYKIFGAVLAFNWFDKTSDKIKGEQGKFVEELKEQQGNALEGVFDVVKDAADMQDEIMENYNKTEEQDDININEMFDGMNNMMENMNNIAENTDNMMNSSTNKFNVSKFNAGLELFAGSANGMQVTNVLDKIITSNKTQERKITVKYQTTETQDETEIKNIKRNFDTFDNCEITYEYDADGFINKAIVEKI